MPLFLNSWIGILNIQYRIKAEASGAAAPGRPKNRTTDNNLIRSIDVILIGKHGVVI